MAWRKRLLPARRRRTRRLTHDLRPNASQFELYHYVTDTLLTT
jgi:hypothetical protein